MCQEPTVCTLSNGRLVCVMRTYTGEIWFSTSDDDGRTWSEADVLRQEPGGAPLLNPVAPCPMYPLSDGRFLLIFYNNDGTANGGNGPADGKKNRTPAWYTVGVENDDAHQPIRFGEPRVLLSNDCVVAGPSCRTEIASYPSFFEYDGTRYFWYPDRKHFCSVKSSPTKCSTPLHRADHSYRSLDWIESSRAKRGIRPKNTPTQSEMRRRYDRLHGNDSVPVRLIRSVYAGAGNECVDQAAKRAQHNRFRGKNWSISYRFRPNSFTDTISRVRSVRTRA